MDYLDNPERPSAGEPPPHISKKLRIAADIHTKRNSRGYFYVKAAFGGGKQDGLDYLGRVRFGLIQCNITHPASTALGCRPCVQ